MNNEKSAHGSLWKSSDFIFIITLILGLVLQKVPALSITMPMSENLATGLGTVLLALGVIVIILAKVTLKKSGQPAEPGKPTTAIVASGVYGVSRNPIYLGLVFVLIGLGLLFANGWWLILVYPMMLALKYFLIIPEEKYLIQRFNDEYTLYINKVRRWI